MSDALLAALPDPSFLVTSSGILRSANAAALELAGLSAEGLPGQPILPLVTEPEGVVRHYLDLCGRTRQSVPGALTWKRRGAASVETRSDGAVVEPGSGSRPALIYLRCRLKEETVTPFSVLNEQIRALSKEVEERRKAEAALCRTEERHRTLVTATSSVVWTADHLGRFCERQLTWEAFTGQSWGEYCGQGALDAVHPEDRARVEKAWTEAMRTGTVFECEFRLRYGSPDEYHHCVSRGRARARSLRRSARMDRHRHRPQRPEAPRGATPPDPEAGEPGRAGRRRGARLQQLAGGHPGELQPRA